MDNFGNKQVGIILLLVSLLANPFLLGFFVTQDNKIDSIEIRIGIITGECILLILSILVYKNKMTCLVEKRKEIFLLCVTILFFLIFLEIMLRVYPIMFGQTFANSVLGVYNTRENGIYYYDPFLNINFMKPNFTIIAYYNGYYWTHKTDNSGFRNEESNGNADIILLGDSYIYGHGLEAHQTVGFFIENITGLSVANLARQGDTSYQELYILNMFGFEYHPKYILYFFFENDLYDLYTHNIEREYFLKTLPNDLYFLKTKPEIEPQEWNETFNSMNNVFVTKKLYLWRVINMLIQKKNLSWQTYNESEAWTYTEKTILLMNALSSEHNATFVIIPITPGNQTQLQKLSMLAKNNSIAFVDTSSVTWANTTLFLEGDGHFSEEGAKVMATMASNTIGEMNR